MDASSLAARIEELRKRRAPREPRWDASALFDEHADELTRLRKRLGGVGEAWRLVCPPDLLPRTAVRSLARGVLTIGVADASTRYNLDRLMREGGERQLVRASPTTVRKVKLVLEAGLGAALSGEPDHSK